MAREASGGARWRDPAATVAAALIPTRVGWEETAPGVFEPATPTAATHAFDSDGAGVLTLTPAGAAANPARMAQQGETIILYGI